MPLAIKSVPATDPAALSPKVTRPAWAVLALAALTGALEVITPEMLAFLGEWKGAAYLVVGVLLQVAVGYRAQDPARSVVVDETVTPSSEPLASGETPTGPEGDALSVIG